MLRLGLPISLLWFGLDQATKWWIIHHVMNPPKVIPITNFFNLVLGRNTGVSFGLLGGTPPWLLMVCGLAIAVALVVWMSRAESQLTTIGLGLIIGGAMGNVLDRFLLGGVTDFLDFYIGQWHWPSFNMADVGIVCGAAILLLESSQSGKKAEPSQP